LSEFKDVDGKILFSLVEPLFVEGMACVLTHGAQKYGKFNWRKVPVEEYVDATERHWNAHRKGIVFDTDTKLFHLDHMAVNLMFQRWHLTNHAAYNFLVSKAINDRMFLEGYKNED